MYTGHVSVSVNMWQNVFSVAGRLDTENSRQVNKTKLLKNAILVMTLSPFSTIVLLMLDCVLNKHVPYSEMTQLGSKCRRLRHVSKNLNSARPHVNTAFLNILTLEEVSQKVSFQ